MTEFYKLLGVDRRASQSDIRKAYLKQSLKWHPDKNHGDEAAERKFQKISTAYSTLSDVRRRKTYDMFGSSETRRSHRRNDSGYDELSPDEFIDYATSMSPHDMFNEVLAQMEADTGISDPHKIWKLLSDDMGRRDEANHVAGFGASVIGMHKLANSAKTGSVTSFASGMSSLLCGVLVARGYTPHAVTDCWGEKVAESAKLANAHDARFRPHSNRPHSAS